MAAFRRLTLCLGSAAVFLAAGVAGPAFAITHGQVDSTGAYGNVGAFVIQAPDGRSDPLCSGTLISPDVFLTAGPCTEHSDEVLVAYGYVAHVTFDGSLPFGDLTDPATRQSQSPTAAGFFALVNATHGTSIPVSACP